MGFRPSPLIPIVTSRTFCKLSILWCFYYLSNRSPQSDGVDSANDFSGQEVAGFSIDILTKYSKKLQKVQKRVNAAKTEVDCVKKEVDDMKEMVDSAIESLEKL